MFDSLCLFIADSSVVDDAIASAPDPADVPLASSLSHQLHDINTSRYHY